MWGTASEQFKLGCGHFPRSLSRVRQFPIGVLGRGSRYPGNRLLAAPCGSEVGGEGDGHRARLRRDRPGLDVGRILGSGKERADVGAPGLPLAEEGGTERGDTGPHVPSGVHDRLGGRRSKPLLEFPGRGLVGGRCELARNSIPFPASTVCVGCVRHAVAGQRGQPPPSALAPPTDLLSV
jgi:hypothetical protein